ncbi:protein ESSENTIAL FOR POTEXVIRUS ACCUMULATION 1 isoform X1 [Raphanus sativus]|uniref:Protein ESSENTIAL FOR POTEXVIRUS ACCUMULATION 1 isoform X1 n=1 Tax=Raphanus sativus TaxID=3726 RepID=A0A6J0L5D6_RAPSA|nr:protein ESSENTIAL FOR POTEXVIRUS ACCUMULATION 1 isoform X1 [Raphanus sativus]
MANSSADSAADHRNKHLSINPPNQIFKDIQGSDNPIPLSPQWLLSKPGKNKAGLGTTVEPQGLQNPVGNNSTGNGEETPDNLKKKDVFRPSIHAVEAGRREGWRDEERDTFSAVRNDRWRNGDKDFGDNKKVDRRDNLGSRQFVEPRRWTDSGNKDSGPEQRRGWTDSGNKDAGTEQRRGPGDRWTDSGNKDAGTEQRRESKWNSRWGPDDKEAENARSKWDEAGKDGEVVREKGPTLPSSDGEHYRPWRPSQGRGRGESLHSQSTPNKQGTAFSHSRGRGDNPAVFSAGRGRVSSGGSLFTSASNQSHPPGSAYEKGESGTGEHYHLRYSRMKLLDVYRMADTVSFEKFPDGFIEVPSLTCEQPSDPLAICAPSSEEVNILDGIEKGKIVSSGAPQTSKDGPSGRNPGEFSQPRQIKPAGSREDMTYAADVSKDESGETRNYPDDKFRPDASHEGYAPFKKGNEVQGNNHVQSPWRQAGERSSRISHDWNDPSADNKLKSSDNVWSHPKDSINHPGSNAMSLPQSKGESRWQIGEDPGLRRQPVFDREREVRKPVPSSPEELILYYKDPQGLIQGPFSGTDIIGWFEAGYFGIDLLVRPASAPSDSPFSLLGDVMPHLRAKSGPPPGFAGAKPSQFIDAAGTTAFPGVGKIHAGIGETDMLQSDMRYKQVGGTVAENRFIESLMSGSLNNSSQGVQGYAVNSSGGLSLPVTDGGADMYLLAKKLELERQRSVASQYSHWPGRESAHLMPGSENVPEAAQQPARSPSADLLSILHGAKDRSAPAVSGPIPAWSHSNQKDDLHHVKSFQTQTSFGVQQQRQPEQNSPLAGLLGQPIENNPVGMLPPDMMLSPEQQSLNLLQQQQLLLQMNAQTPLSSQQQRLLFEKMLLLKHQQKREEQQQQLLRQQQQLFSQVLADQQHPQQRFGEPSYGQLQQSFDALRLQESKSMTQVNQQMELPVSHEDRAVNLTDFLSVNQATNQNVAAVGTHNLHLQHQLFGNIDPRMSERTVLPDQIHDTHKKDSESDYERTIPADYMNSLYSGKPGYRATLGVEGPVSFPTNESATLETSDIKSLEKQTEDVYAGQKETSNELNVEIPPTEVKSTEVSGGRKTFEKKSKKQRGNKQSAEPVKAASKSSMQEAKQPETGYADDSEIKGKNMNSADNLIDNDAHLIQSSPAAPSSNVLTSSEAISVREESGANESSLQNTRTQPGRAWKPAPGFKPKSLLEIQMEEQRVAQAEALAPKVSTSFSSVGSASPWGGIVASSDPINLRETQGESVITQTGVVKPESVPALKGKQSHMRDLLADDVVAKSVVKERDVVGNNSSDTYTQVTSTNAESLDDDNFINAKETKKNRKKSARAKNAAAKIAAQVPAVDTSLSASSIEKGKSSRIAQQQVKEDLPAIPSGPSLGDFVLWKEEPVNNPSPAAAWSTGPKKSTKPSSLRDIVREQEKMTTSSHPPPSPVPITQKPTPPQAVPQSSWSRSPSQAVSQSSLQSKSKGDDDLFWGPVEQTTQESKQGDFPQLSSQNSWGTKTTPGKGSAGSSLNRQKSVSASSPASHKGKKEEVTKLTEANGFRDWCRSECLRLLGSEDTSVLEFCLKLSRSEAETLLIENLGTVDRDHKFIDKFLNYKDLLPSEVVEIAFQSKGVSSSLSSSVVKSRNNNKAGEEEEYYKAPLANEGFSKVGGKKKGKKGKKVSLSSSVLGFNVVSNRIMMGEIQSIED